MVIHILKDGSKVTDITGKVVKMSDARPLYNMMIQLSAKKTAPRR